MTALLAALLALAVPPTTEDGQTASRSESAHELRSAMRSALASESRAESPQQRWAAVADIVRYYGELKTNDRMAYRERIRWRAKLRSRLGRVADDLRRETARTSGSHERATGAAGGQAVDDPAAALVELIESSLSPESWAKHGGRGVVAPRGGAAAAGGGAFGGGMHGGGGAMGKARQAEALIELIQKTIRPETWEINGGQGTIMYWPGS
jgi:hypothetical protein